MMMDTSHYIFVQTHGMCNSSGLWVLMMCQCGFISRNKYTTLVGDVDNTGGYAFVGPKVYGASLHLPLNLAVNLKLPLKIK